MKIKLIALLVFIMAIGSNYAQDKGDVEFGIGGGLNTSTVSDGDGNSNNSTRTRSSYNLGLSADYYFSDRWSLKGKVIYDQKGWNARYVYSVNGNESFNTGNFHLSYITIPINANWHFGRTRNWYLNFGPYIGFLTQAKFEPDGADVKSSFKSVDAGFSFDIGIKIPLSESTKFFIELGGAGGASNIIKSTDGSSINNSRGSFNIGINFR